jgi:hypothetical protein
MPRRAGERDYRDLQTKDGKKPLDTRRDPRAEDRNWWDKRDTACAQVIRSTIDLLMKAQTQRMRQQTINARLYGNRQINQTSGTSFGRGLNSQASSSRDRISYNVVQENVDTLVARVGEVKPRPYFLTNGGDYKQQRKAKKLNQFIEGSFYETKAYDIGLGAFRDGAIQGDGYVFVCGRAGKLHKERVRGSELWVDEIEAQYGFPRNLHRLKTVDKDELAGRFSRAEDRKAIYDASRSIEPGATQSASNMVTVAESWHLGAEDEDGKTKGGKHAITLVSSNYMLDEPEDWPYAFFPFARWMWCPNPDGYWSQSLGEQLQATQMELNRVDYLIQRSMHLMGGWKLALHNGSKVVTEAVNNDVGTILKWAGTHEPKYLTPEPVAVQYFQRRERLIEQARDIAGTSKMQTAGQKPAGELSGKALQTLEDVASDRHRSIQRMNDNGYLEMAMLDIVMASEMAEAGDLKPVRVPGKTSFSTIDWEKDIVDVKTDAYVLQCFPISKLPKDPQGRLQTIQEYIQAGFITPRQGRRALDFPDLETIESLANAQEDMLSKTFDAIVDDGEYAPPEPTDDLQLGKQMVLEYIQKYRALGLEEEKLDMLRTFNSQVDAMLAKSAQIQAAQQMAAAPQAAPMAPPQSALIPNAPAP